METLHTDIYDMLVEMKQHAAQNGRSIISRDLPMQLKLGYECQNTGKLWAIKITDLRKSLDEHREKHSELEVNIFRRAFLQEGRQTLLDVINGK